LSTAETPRRRVVVPFPNPRRRQAVVLAYLRALLIDLDREIESGCRDRDFLLFLLARADEAGLALAATLGIPEAEIRHLVEAKAWLQYEAQK
jgi:hypothetical protein